MNSISYVITVFNKAGCLPLLISSLQKQIGDFEKEFIFVDDGSSDNSFDVLQSLVPRLGGKILTQINQGPSVAVNHGLSEAKHEWVFLIDGDDYIYEDASLTLLDLATQYPDAVVCKGKHSNYNNQDKFNGAVTYYQNPLAKALKLDTISSSCVIIKRDVALSVGGCDARVFVQDYSIALRMATKGSFVEINKLMAVNIDKGQIRLSGNKLRKNYCTALARCLFIKDHPDLIYQDQYEALRAQLRKAWKWHLKNKFPPKFKHFLRYIQTRFNFTALSRREIVKWFEESLEVYN